MCYTKYLNVRIFLGQPSYINIHVFHLTCVSIVKYSDISLSLFTSLPSVILIIIADYKTSLHRDVALKHLNHASISTNHLHNYIIYKNMKYLQKTKFEIFFNKIVTMS